MRAEAQAHVDQIRSALDLLRRFLDWDRALRRLDELNSKVEDPALWNDAKAAQEVMRERRRLDEAINATRKITSELDDTIELMEMAEAEGDEGVDDGERVGDDVEDEVVSITWRRGQHDDDGDEPVLEETGERGVERPVAGEEAGVRQDTFAAELLDDSALREDHRQNVTEGRQSDEDRKCALSSGTHDVAEEGSCKNASR